MSIMVPSFDKKRLKMSYINSYYYKMSSVTSNFYKISLTMTKILFYKSEIFDKNFSCYKMLFAV